MADPWAIRVSGSKVGSAKEIDTEPLKYVAEFDDSLIKNQVDSMPHDTEVLNDLDLVENSEAQLLDEFDTEVVPDSDVEALDTAKNKASSFRSGSFSNSCAGDLYKSNIQAKDLHFKDGDIFEAKDKDLISSVDCHKCADNMKQLYENVELDENDKVNQPKRKVNIVYARKRKRITCTFQDKGLCEEMRSPIQGDKYARLSYIESQEAEAEDVSKALLFVDQYVSVNAMHSSPVAEVIKEKSPPALSAKGTKNLVRWANLRNRTVETGIFEWDHSEGQTDFSVSKDQLPFRGKNFGQIYVRRSPSVRDTISDILQKNKADNSNNKEELNGLTYSGAKLVYDFKNTGDFNQFHEKEAKESPGEVLDPRVDGESAFTNLGDDILNQSGHVFDVGNDTQMAAEAIQALSNAAPACYNDAEAYQCRRKMLSESLSTPMRCPIQIWSFPKKARSACRGKVKCPKDSRRISCLDDQEDILQGSDLEVTRHREKLLTGKCISKDSSKNSGKVMFTKRSIIKRPKKVKMDACKENLYSLVSNHHDLPRSNTTCHRKHMVINPYAGNLSSLTLVNMNEGLLNESIGRKIVNKKVGPDDKRKEMGVNHCILNHLDQTEKCSKIRREKTCNNRNMRETGNGKKCGVVDDPTVNRSIDVRIDQMEIGLYDQGKDRGLSANMSEVLGVKETIIEFPCLRLSNAENAKSSQEDTSYAHARPRNWYMRDYPRGKRTSGSILSHYAKSVKVNYSCVTRDESRHCSSRSKFNSNSSFHSSCFGSSMKRKLRSSVYISPCWLSSQKNHDGSSLKQCVDAQWQIGLVNDNDNATENRNISEQLSKSTISMPLDNVVTMGSTSTVCGIRRKEYPRLVPNKSELRHQSHIGLPNSPLLNEMDFANEIDGNYEQPGKKKATTSPLTRELVRLGFIESMPEFTSKDSRRRKTMANIRILLSKNLDKGTRNQQMKILHRLGVPLVSCPADATHFVTDKFVRTRNLLEFIAKGKPVVTHLWLESCEQAGSYIDEGSYILRDVKKEVEVGFRLPMSLEKARNHPILKGYWVAITPNTRPDREMLSSLVMASHGQAIEVPMESTIKDKMALENLLLLSCEEDRAYCTPFRQKGVAAYSPELLLNGIVTQKLEFARHQLFTLTM